MPSPVPSPPGSGTIAGHVSYPSEYLPAQLVYAISTTGGGAYSVETTIWQSSYTIVGVKPGTYFVYTTTRLVQLGANCKTTLFGGGFTKAVPCGLAAGCDDHSPLPVTVRAGQVTAGIDPGDWYAPTTSFYPAPPPSVVPDGLWRGAKGGAFSTPLLAVEDFGPADAKAYLAGTTRSGCPVNRACLSLSAPGLGTHAAYVVGIVGSNSNVHTCVFLAYQDAGGWHSYAIARCPLSTAFPVHGAVGRVEVGMGARPTDCVNARSTPGLSGKVLSCVREGTAIEIDGGPYWLAPPKNEFDGFWWHVKGKGWMLNRYLEPRY